MITPGEWVIEWFNRGKHNESITITAWVDGHPVEIADISDMGMPEAEGNARLISAAPEGYQLAQLVINGPNNPDEMNEIRRLAKAIVAKVDGKA